MLGPIKVEDVDPLLMNVNPLIVSESQDYRVSLPVFGNALSGDCRRG